MKTATMDSPIATSYEIIWARRAQTAQQRVGRAGGPAAQHDAVDAHRRAGQHHQHRHRDVGDLQRRAGARRCDTIGPNGMTENAVNAQIAEIIGAKKKTTLSAARGRMSSLNGQLHAVGEGLQQAERADLVRAGPHRHPGHDPPLEPDREAGHATPEDEDGDDLDEDEPPRVVAEVGQRRVLRQDA